MWGGEFSPGGKHMANTWQGKFPHENNGADGFKDTSPGGTFAANGYGLYDMAGNVWEWTRSQWDNYPAPAASEQGAVWEARAMSEMHDRVQRGGSFLYSASPVRCAYRVMIRTHTRDRESGFRLAVVPLAGGKTAPLER